jgi:hypothetical protein
LKGNQCFEENIASIFKIEEGKQRFACCLLHAGFLLGLLFSPENGGDMFLRNLS